MDSFFPDVSGHGKQTHPVPAQTRLGQYKEAPGIARKVYYRCEIARPDDGYSLLELMASAAILLVIAAATFSVISRYQKTYVTTQLKADLFQSMRGATALMAQEIGQAGLVSLPASTITSSPVSRLATAQTATVSSVTSMFVGEKVLVDAGTFQELVTLAAVNVGALQITGVFNNNHPIGTPIKVEGVFSNGIMSSSTATQLRLFGDINADGSLVYIHYDCDTVAGTLTRSATTVTPTATTSSPSQILVNTLVASSGLTGCFTYPNPLPSVNGYTFVTNVAVTLSARTSVVDPVTHTYLTMTKSFMNLTPRNLLGGLELANAQFTDQLQPTPPNLPLP